MQVSSSLIAAQAAAREAQARFQAQIRGQQAPAQAGAASPADGFAPLPLKQVQGPAPGLPQAAPAGPQAAAGRLGQHIDITV
jgi:hypothetical protein